MNYVNYQANNHMDANVPVDKDAFYTVKAVIGGAETDGGPVGVLIGVKPLEAPAMAGALHSEKGLTIRWNIVAGAVFYNAFKSSAKDGPYALLGSFQDTKLIDVEVKEGQTYFYKVSAIDKNNTESPQSEVLEYTIPEKAEHCKKLR